MKNEKFATTMQPSGFTKFLRTCMIFQFFRFIFISISLAWLVMVVGR